MYTARFSALAGVFLGLSLPGVGVAENQQVEPPPPPPVMRSGEALEPEVTIREAQQETVYEYRVGGRLVMVKVQPKGGLPPYYYYNQDNDPELERSNVDPRYAPNINQWVLFRWW